MSKEVLLSICIPTYNRANLLKDILSDIYENLCLDWVEVVVVDDCSDDNTSSICNHFKSKWDNFRYIQNETRNGVVKNITKSMELGSGKYVSLLKDTDYINAELVKSLESLLLNKDYNGVYAAVSLRDSGKSFVKIKKTRQVEFVRTWRDAQNVFRAHGTPGCILKKDQIDFNALRENEKDAANIYAQTIAGVMVAFKGNLLFHSGYLNAIIVSPKHSMLASYYSSNTENSKWNLIADLPYFHAKNRWIVLNYQLQKLRELKYIKKESWPGLNKFFGFLAAMNFYEAKTDSTNSLKDLKELRRSYKSMDGIGGYFVVFLTIKKFKLVLNKVRNSFKFIC